MGVGCGEAISPHSRDELAHEEIVWEMCTWPPSTNDLWNGELGGERGRDEAEYRLVEIDPLGNFRVVWEPSSESVVEPIDVRRPSGAEVGSALALERWELLSDGS